MKMKQFIAFSRDKGENHSIKDIYDQKKKKIGAVGHRATTFSIKQLWFISF